MSTFSYAFILSKPDVQQCQSRIYIAVVMKALICLYRKILQSWLFFILPQMFTCTFPIEQNYGGIIALYKGASSVRQNYIKLSTYVPPPSILQESLKSSRRHKSPFKSHYQFLPNVLGLSRWFMTPPLMNFFVLFCVRTFSPNTRIKHVRQ